MGNYATVANVRAFKINGHEVDLAAYTDAEIEEAIEVAEHQIEEITNDIFYPKTATYKFSGDNGDNLFFSKVVPYRLLTITSVKSLDDDGTTVLDTYAATEDYIQYPFYLSTSDAAGSSVRRSLFRGKNWPRGQENIEIAGVWGALEVPAGIKRATILLTLENLISGCTNMLSADYTQATWSDFTIQTRQNYSGESYTGFPVVDRILCNFINNADLMDSVE